MENTVFEGYEIVWRGHDATCVLMERYAIENRASMCSLFKIIFAFVFYLGLRSYSVTYSRVIVEVNRNCAFVKTLTLFPFIPNCFADISGYSSTAWIPLIN